MFKLTSTVILLVLFNINAAAHTILLNVIETGLTDSGSGHQHSVLWESAFMDVFFDAGHIVTNAPILRMERKPHGDIINLIDIDEAKDCGSDYIIITQLDYSGESVLPRDVLLYIYEVNTQKKIFQQIVERRRNDLNDLKTIARGLVPYIME
ncbi:MAG: hypothetical protein FWD14_00985 [Treponema sp.]|nr:hypothetical protein [Treponema sp.]